MNKEEALSVAREQLVHYRSQKYEQLLRLLENPDALVGVGPSGVKYHLQVEAVWDDPPKPDLRVWAVIDDGSLWRSISPLSQDFIIRPDGSFVGE
jgi:hypothetical protein